MLHRAAAKRGVSLSTYIAQVLIENGFSIDEALLEAHDTTREIPDIVRETARKELEDDDGD